MTVLGVIVTAGGRGRRLGPERDGDKLAADVAGRVLLDRTLDGLVPDAVVVCVGPERATTRPVTWVRESPAFGGPLAAVAAGAAALPAEVTQVLLLGGDMPAGTQALPALLAALARGDDAGRTSPTCAVVTDSTGRRQPLLSVWQRPALADRLERLAPTDGRALASLLDTLTLSEVTEVADAWGAADDVDTPDDLARARDRFDQQSP